MADGVEQQEKFVQQEAERSQIVVDLASTRINQFQDVEALLDQVVEQTRANLYVDRVVIYRFNPDWSGSVITESVAPSWPSALNQEMTPPLIPEELLTAYRAQHTIPTNDISAAGLSPEYLQWMQQLQIQADLVAPIIYQDQLFGLLIAQDCSASHAWQPFEITFLEQLAEQLGKVLDRVYIIQQQQAETDRLQRLKDITVELSGAMPPDRIFNLSVQAIREALQADRVIVYTFDEKWQGTIISESVAEGWPIALGAQITDPCFAKDYAEKYKEGRVKATSNIYEAGLTECHLKQLEPFAVKANLVAPIIVGDELPGLLIAHQCSGPRDWMPSEINFFSQLATQVGLSLSRSQLFAQQRADAERSTLLKDITLSLSTSLSTQEVFDKAVQEIRPAMQSDRVVVYTFDENWKGTIVAESMMGDWPRALGAKIADPCFA
ncbi:MAG: GAF domain-containing protein, partial [Cyanothece sp. SIO1E1]|nr:GAF domain-containing protein [Cyanothece sp. SIO1E1]